MNSFFRRLPLTTKLILIGLVPLLFLIYLTSSVYFEKKQKLVLLENYIQRIDQSANITRLIDELQAERQYSYEYILKKDRRVEMLRQRVIADSIIHEIETANDSTLKGFTAYTFLKDLASTRTRIDSGKISANTIMNYFSSSVFRLNTLNGVTPADDVYLKSVYQDMAGQKLLSEMLTYLGLIHANVYNVLYTRQYMVETMMGTYPSFEIYNSYKTEFLQKASPEIVASYNKIRETTPLNLTDAYLDRLFKVFKFDSSYNSEQWAVISSKTIDALRRLQMGLLHNVETRMNNLYDREVTDKNKTLFFLILTLLLAIGIVFYCLQSISRMLKELKDASLKIANGETDIHFKDMPNDVIGSLAHSILKIDNNNKALARSAESIGHGHFDVLIEPRSNNDLLGNAIVKMKENLQLSIKETEESREEFRQLADLMPQIVWTARPDGYLDYYNKRWYEFTGFKEGYGDQSWVPVLHHHDAQYCLDSWYESVFTGKPYEIEYRFKDRTSGGYRWFLGRAVPIYNTEGNIVKWFGTCTDINEQKTRRQKLEILVKERTQELERSNDDLQQFAHVASHDLKEPLRKIRIFSSRFKEEFSAVLQGSAMAYIDKIQNAAERMSAMIEGVLNYSSTSHAEQNQEIIDLNEIIEGIRQDLEVVIREKNAIIEHDPLPKIKGVRVLIYQLFYNLLNNALKFSKPGKSNHISIKVNKFLADEVHEHSYLVPGKEYISIEVNDQGIGFDPAYSERMFQIFTRLNPKDQYEGTGLGLALCKKIVMRHEGEITATGKENEGASFKVMLPAGERE